MSAPGLTIRQAAARVHVSPRTISTWLKAGRLSLCVRTAGGRGRIDLASLLAAVVARPPRVPRSVRAEARVRTAAAVEPACSFCHEPGRHGPGGAGCLRALDRVARKVAARRGRIRRQGSD